MKRLSFLLVAVLSLSMILAACGSAEEQGSSGPGGTGEYGMATEQVEQPGAVETPAAELVQPGAVETSTVEAAQPGWAESPTAEATQPVAGEAPTQGADQDETIPSTGAVQVNRVSNLIDFEVWNAQGEQVGDVKALVIDMNGPQVKYVVLGTGGFLGIGEELIPVPYEALQLRTSAEASTQQSGAEGSQLPPNIFVLNVSKDQLEQAPTIEGLDVIHAQQQAAPQDQGQKSETRPFAEREQEIRSYWENQVEAISSQSGAQQPDNSQTGDQMAGAGQQQWVLAQDLLGATVRGPGVAQEMSGQPDQSSEDQGQASGDQGQTKGNQQSNTEEAAAQDLGQVQDITIDYHTGEGRYVLVYLNSDVPAAGQGQTAGDEGQMTGDQGQITGSQQTQSPDVGTANEYLIAVPLSAFQWNADEQVLTYTGTRSLMESPTINSQELETGDWQSKADAFWSQGSQDHTNNQPAS